MKSQSAHIATLVSSALAGIIFGLGLILAGMANPAKVLAFLDLAGLWDPSLALVMVGAIAVGLIAFSFAKKRQLSLLGLKMQLPTMKNIDKRLTFGGLAFGIGWGLSGICPAPAFVLLGTGSKQGLIFVIAMLCGMVIFEIVEHKRNLANRTKSS
jgi:uncharacterized membrane protein YedE/YeeE